MFGLPSTARLIRCFDIPISWYEDDEDKISELQFTDVSVPDVSVLYCYGALCFILHVLDLLGFRID